MIARIRLDGEPTLTRPGRHECPSDDLVCCGVVSPKMELGRGARWVGRIGPGVDRGPGGRAWSPRPITPARSPNSRWGPGATAQGARINRARMGGRAGTSGGGRMQAAVVVGIDVSKRTLEVALSSGRAASSRLRTTRTGSAIAGAAWGPRGARAGGAGEPGPIWRCWEAGVCRPPPNSTTRRDAYHFAQANRQIG